MKLYQLIKKTKEFIGEMVGRKHPLCFMRCFSQKLITAYGTSFKRNEMGASVVTDFTEHFPSGE